MGQESPQSARNMASSGVTAIWDKQTTFHSKMAPKQQDWKRSGGCMLMFILLTSQLSMTEAQDTTHSASSQLDPSHIPLQQQHCTPDSCSHLRTFPLQLLACITSLCADADTAAYHGKRWLDTGYYAMFPQSRQTQQCIRNGCEGLVGIRRDKCHVDCQKLMSKRDWTDPTMYDKDPKGKPAWLSGKRELEIDPMVYRLASLPGMNNWVDTMVHAGKNEAGKGTWIVPSDGNNKEEIEGTGHKEDVSSDTTHWVERMLFGDHDITDKTSQGLKGDKKWLDPMTYRNKRWLDPMTYRNNRAKPTPKSSKRSVEIDSKGIQTGSQRHLQLSLMYCSRKCDQRKESNRNCPIKCLENLHILR